MIQDELTKLAEEQDDEEDEGDAEKNVEQSSSRGAQAWQPKKKHTKYEAEGAFRPIIFCSSIILIYVGPSTL